MIAREKAHEGLGFCEIKTFNVALLTKMVPRILTELNALWICVLKGIYFPNYDFMEVIRGGRESWGWTSLLVGRDIL